MRIQFLSLFVSYFLTSHAGEAQGSLRRSLQEDELSCADKLKEYRNSNSSWATIDISCFDCAATSARQSTEEEEVSAIHCGFKSIHSSSQWAECVTNSSESVDDLETTLVFDGRKLGVAAVTDNISNISYMALNASWGIAQGCDTENGDYVYMLGKTLAYDDGNSETMYNLLDYSTLGDLKNDGILNATLGLIGEGISGIGPATEENPEPCAFGHQWGQSLLGTCSMTVEKPAEATAETGGDATADGGNNANDASSSSSHGRTSFLATVVLGTAWYALFAV